MGTWVSQLSRCLESVHCPFHRESSDISSWDRFLQKIGEILIGFPWLCGEQWLISVVNVYFQCKNFNIIIFFLELISQNWNWGLHFLNYILKTLNWGLHFPAFSISTEHWKNRNLELKCRVLSGKRTLQFEPYFHF